MTFPRFLLAATLAFWGWQAELWWPAASMALVLEARFFLVARWGVGAKDFNRIVDLCILLAVGAAVYLFLTPEKEGFGLTLVHWSPLFLFPLVAAQAYSASGRVPAAALLMLGRGKAKEGGPAFDVQYGYYLACLFAAGAANTRSEWFFPALAVLLCWLGWTQRPRRYGLGLWLLCWAIAAALGFWGQNTIDVVQSSLRGWGQRHEYRTTTAIGDIGAIKTSDAIVMRVARPETPAPGGLLLREASYSFFTGKAWLATDAGFSTRVAESGGEGAWQLQDGEGTQRVVIYRSFPRRAGLIVAPSGALRLEELPARKLETNRLAALRVTNIPGLVAYRVRFSPALTWDGPPDAVDAAVLPNLREAACGVATELGLEGMDISDAIAALKSFFARRFTYTLALQRVDAQLPAVADFILKTRAGHCEYFATAAVFILRAAGFRARYATGFAVQEYSSREGLYLVREKHAHAWALAYADGVWRDADVTPATWFGLEQSEETIWTRFADFRSELAFGFARWRWLEEKSGTKRVLLWCTIPLGAFIAYRIARRHGIRRVRGPGVVYRREKDLPGADSEFELVAARLAHDYGERRRWEPLEQWVARLQRMFPLLEAIPEVMP